MSFDNTESNMELNMELNTPKKRNRSTQFKRRIERITNKMVQLVNENPIFTLPLTVDVIQNDDNSIYVYFNLTSETYVIGLYYGNNSSKGKCTYVNSDLGMKTGTFLFHLLLLLNAELGIEDFTLENFTDVQVRGATGIYKLLSVDKRGADPSVFIGASLAEQLSEVFGSMRLQLRGDTKEAIIAEFYNIMEKLTEADIDVSNPNNPWDPDFAYGITQFLRQMSEQYFGAMGGKKTRKIKKTRKTRKTRKIKKTRKNKKNEKKQKNEKVKKFKKTTYRIEYK